MFWCLSHGTSSRPWWTSRTSSFPYACHALLYLLARAGPGPVLLLPTWAGRQHLGQTIAIPFLHVSASSAFPLYCTSALTVHLGFAFVYSISVDVFNLLICYFVAWWLQVVQSYKSSHPSMLSPSIYGISFWHYIFLSCYSLYQSIFDAHFSSFMI